MQARPDVAALAMLYASPRPVRDVPAAALLAIEPEGRAVRVIVEAPAGQRRLLTVEDASDARLSGLRPIDRRRVALMLAEVRR